MYKLQNQKGLTLLEVLLSIVILTIILVTVMKFFPQMGVMNKQNENKTTAINLAKKELVQWQGKGALFKTFLLNPTEAVIPEYDHAISKDDSSYHFISVKDGFNVEVLIRKTPDLNTNPSKAYQIYIKIKNDSNVTISETYGYLFFSEGGRQ